MVISCDKVIYFILRITAYSRNNNGSYKTEELPQDSVKIAYWYALYYCWGLSFPIDYLRVKINSIIPGDNDGQNGEIEFKLKSKTTQKVLFQNQSCNSVFTSIVFPSEQCVSVFKSTTSKHILCCSEHNRNDNLGVSCIYFHCKIDNACISIKWEYLFVEIEENFCVLLLMREWCRRNPIVAVGVIFRLWLGERL